VLLNLHIESVSSFFSTTNGTLIVISYPVLAENAESESVRLGATRDLLDRAGFRPVDRHEIVKEKSVEELNAQLVSLVGENGAELLVGALRSRRSISGPELTK
jgi:hypothetical protein